MIGNIFSNRALRSRSPVFDTADVKSVTYFIAFLIGYISFFYVKTVGSAVVFALFLITVSYKYFKLTRPLIILFLIFAFVAGYLVGFVPYNKAMHKYEGFSVENFSGNFKITSDVEFRDNSIRFESVIADGEYKDEKVLVTLYETDGISLGRNDIISIEEVNLLGQPPYEIDRQILNVSSSFKDGIYIRATGRGVVISQITDGNPGIYGLFSEIKKRINTIFLKHLDKDSFDFVSGVLTGYKDYNNEDFNRILSNTGLSHVVVVSGMHFSILIFIILAILRFFYISVKRAAAITLVISIIIALFFGITPSVLRALIITDLLLFADIFSRDKNNSLHFLILTADIMIVFNPMIIYDIGFVLSFASVIGLILFSARFNKVFSFLPKGVRDIVSASLSANIITLPLLAYYFNTLSFGFIFGNLIVTPLISVVMIYAVISVIVFSISATVGGFMLYAMNFLLGFIFVPLRWISEIDFLHYKVIKPAFNTIMIYYIMMSMVICLNFPKRKYVKYFIVVLAVIYSGLSLFVSDGYPFRNSLDYYALGETLSGKVVMCKAGRTIVCDISGNDEYYDLKTIIDKKCRSEVDLYIVSDIHSLDALYSISDDIDIKKVVYPVSFKENILVTEKISNTAEECISADLAGNIIIKDIVFSIQQDNFGNILGMRIVHNKNTINISRDFNKIPEESMLNILSYKNLKYLSNNKIQMKNVLNETEEKIYTGSVK